MKAAGDFKPHGETFTFKWKETPMTDTPQTTRPIYSSPTQILPDHPIRWAGKLALIYLASAIITMIALVMLLFACAIIDEYLSS